MQSLQQLNQIFEAAFPDIVSEPPLLIRASEDSKVGQFKGHKNSVGFLAGYSCRWMTPFCYGECYTERGQAGMDIARTFRAENTWALFAYLLAGDCEGLTQNFSTLIQKSVDQYHRRLAKTEDAKERRALESAGSMWRWMWSGDLVDATHAMAVRDSTAMHPDTTAWIYTRSFHLLQFLEPVPSNLTVWLSEDRDNTQQADRFASQFPWVRRTTLNPEESVPSTGVICPENTGKYPVIGACARCKICSHSTADEVHFIAKPMAGYRRSVNETLLTIAA